jgi:adenosylhomocysteine nucleosidase
MKNFAIVIAVRPEAEAILADRTFDWRDEEDGLYVSESRPLRLVISGVGKVYAAWAFSRVWKDADAVVSLGTSGGLSDEKVGGAWIAHEFVEHDMCVDSLGFPPGVTPYGPLTDPVMRTCPPWLLDDMENACRSKGIAYSKGRAMAGDEFVNDAARAARKLGLFSARIVDMESAAMAKLAASFTHTPFAALRIVSDNANHESGMDWAANVRKAAIVLDDFLLAMTHENG